MKVSQLQLGKILVLNILCLHSQLDADLLQEATKKSVYSSAA